MLVNEYGFVTRQRNIGMHIGKVNIQKKKFKLNQCKTDVLATWKSLNNVKYCQTMYRQPWSIKTYLRDGDCKQDININNLFLI